MSDRKYSHRGYQDSGKRDDGPRTPSAPQSRPEGPRGRSVGTEADAVFKCGKCGERVVTLEDITPGFACRNCANPLHTCGHCAHYDPSRPRECAKPVPARIARKHEGNDCSLFAPRVVLDLTGPKAAGPADARDAFEQLFRKR